MQTSPAQPANTVDDTAMRMEASLKRHAGQTLLTALDDPNTCEVMRNPDGVLWIERLGEPMQQLGTLAENHARGICNIVAKSLQRVITPENPQLDGEWPLDGSRFSGAIPPLVASPIFSIRKRASRLITLEEYVQQGVMTPFQRDILRSSVAEKKNIIVVGGTSSGKTTLTNALIAEIVAADPLARIIIAEDTLELQCHAQNALFMRTVGNVTMTKILKQILRLRPDRICIGEVRDKTALDLMDAWNTGHEGGIATLHASSASKGLSRLRGLISRNEAAPDNIEEVIAEAVHRIVFIERTPKGRKVKSILAVHGYSRTDGSYSTTRLDTE